MATGSKRPTGFTLIELGIVVFVLALMVALAAPKFVRAYNGALLSETARNFATTCQYARVQAVTQQQPATVHVDARQQRFWLTQSLPAEDGPAVEHTLRAVQVPGRITLVRAEAVDTNETAAASAVLVRFYPNGTCDAATVVFRGHEKGDVAVTLDPITGKAAVGPTKS